MTNFEIACRFAGVSGRELAERLGVTPQYISQLATGKRSPGPNNVWLLARALDVDAAWLLGAAQALPLADPLEGTVYTCPVIRSEEIPDYGVLYHVYLDQTGDIVPVILSGGVQLTPTDWTALAVRCAADIGGCAWMGPGGRDAVMLDGLPRVMI